jgi:hypothetical protein
MGMGMLKKSDKKKREEADKPIQTQSAQDLEAIAKLGPNPDIIAIMALHRLDG